MAKYRQFESDLTIFDLQRRGEWEFFLALLMVCSCGDEVTLVPSHYPAWN